MLLQAVFFAYRGEYRLGHYGVAVADAQLVGHNHVCTGLTAVSAAAAPAPPPPITSTSVYIGTAPIKSKSSIRGGSAAIRPNQDGRIRRHWHPRAGWCGRGRCNPDDIGSRALLFGQIGAHGQRRAAQRLQGLGVIHAFIEVLISEYPSWHQFPRMLRFVDLLQAAHQVDRAQRARGFHTAGKQA